MTPAEWVAQALDSAPDITDEQARRVSALLFTQPEQAER